MNDRDVHLREERDASGKWPAIRACAMPSGPSIAGVGSGTAADGASPSGGLWRHPRREPLGSES